MEVGSRLARATERDARARPQPMRFRVRRGALDRGGQFIIGRRGEPEGEQSGPAFERHFRPAGRQGLGSVEIAQRGGRMPVLEIRLGTLDP
ncbi:MAG: hypothetical protein E6K72_11175 [Candidatus Eisenbacteria bacterium]|uniref:Uncharacterized protein n=1 Tax=Eiseniibacteriota bacterium TaxID=2212470 RepID=A0A538SHC0_UNCEI|nr:MAG: hypothetical protein E6K72_11175 [Candidatus Eisenbacteria bacterium]